VGRIRRAAWLLCLGTCLVLAGCGGDGSSRTPQPAAADRGSTGGTATSTPAGSDDAAADSGAQPTTTVDPAAPGFPPTQSAVVVHLREFTSPTGNITCQLRREAAACVIAEHDYPASDRPDGCGGRWLPFFQVDRTRAARLGPCEGGVVAPSGGALRYGTTSVVGPMSCLSRISGMVCWSSRSGHGFRLARAAYDLH
jgi:hypothetical protein